MKMNKKGFTLIEMLVVIAIIAVLVSIVIPVVGNSTEKAKEAADAANIRSAIAKVTTQALAGDVENEIVELTHNGGFSIMGAEDGEMSNIGGFNPAIFTGDVTVSYCEDCQCVTVQIGEVVYDAESSNADTPAAHACE